MELTTAMVDGFHPAHSICSRVKGASKQYFPKAQLSSTHCLTHTSSSRTNFFKTCVMRDRLDDPPARLDAFSRNVETFIGVGKYARGIYCLQETKSTHTDILKLSHAHTHLYHSGTPDDPHAGVAIPSPLIPSIYDFHPWNSRIAVLILNTRPHRLAIFSIYAPSTLQDPSVDLRRKQQFWDNLQSLIQHYNPEYIPIFMGDFNTRLWQNQLDRLESYIGLCTFSSTIEDDLLPPTQTTPSSPTSSRTMNSV